MKRSSIVVVTALVAAAALGRGGTAEASHTDSIYPTANTNWSCSDGGLFCLTDNTSLTVYRQSSVQSAMVTATSATLNNSYNVTDLTVIYASTPSYSGDSETDIVYQGLTNLPSDVWGKAWCDDAVTGSKCDQHYVAFNNYLLDDGWVTADMRRSLACHETGHAVGLTHGGEASPRVSGDDPALACMVLSTWPTNLGQHNLGQINGAY